MYFSLPRWARQDGHCVILHPRIIRSRHGGHERFPGYGPGVRGIVRPQVVDEKGVQPGYTIPGQPVQVICHRVEGLAGHAIRQHAFEYRRSSESQDPLQVNPQAIVVRVPPLKHTVFLLMPPPGERGDPEHLLRKTVIVKPAFQHWIIFQDVGNVGRCVLEAPLAVPFEAMQP